MVESPWPRQEGMACGRGRIGTVVSRLLWPGIGRMVIEESRRLPAGLVVYRESPDRQVYRLPDIAVRYLRHAHERSRWTPHISWATLRFNPDRGSDATVDLDLIVRASGRLAGPILYHDQYAALTGLLRRWRFGAEYSVYVHETTLGDRRGVMDLTLQVPRLAGLLRAYDREIVREARVVFTNSQRNQEILRNVASDVRVAYPGCEPLPELPTERERFALAVAVWERTKRPEVYAELARRSGVKIVMAGMWGRPEEMESFRTRFGSLVRVTGKVPEGELDALSRTASLYVRFGFGERGPGQGGIQALAYGLPVLSNPGLAVSEIIEPGIDGYVVPDLESGAQKLAELFDSPQQLRRMSEAAWVKSRRFSWEEHARKVREGLEELRTEEGPGSPR